MVSFVSFFVDVSLFFLREIGSCFVEGTGVEMIGAEVIITLVVPVLSDVSVWIVSTRVQVLVQSEVELVCGGCFGSSNKSGSELSFHMNLFWR